MEAVGMTKAGSRLASPHERLRVTVHVDVAACIRWLFAGVAMLVIVYRTDAALLSSQALNGFISAVTNH